MSKEEIKDEVVEELKEEQQPEIKKEKKKKENKEVEKLKEQNKELSEKVLRVTAEMQNMRRRYDEEISRIYKYDGEDLAKKLLPIIDNFERAISLDDNNLAEEQKKFLEGFKMIYANLINILKEKGIVEIECLGKEFDPNFMDAILTESIIEEEPNIVLDVLQKGYKYNDKVIRPAMVKVNE